MSSNVKKYFIQNDLFDLRYCSQSRINHSRKKKVAFALSCDYKFDLKLFNARYFELLIMKVRSTIIRIKNHEINRKV